MKKPLAIGISFATGLLIGGVAIAVILQPSNNEPSASERYTLQIPTTSAVTARQTTIAAPVEEVEEKRTDQNSPKKVEEVVLETSELENAVADTMRADTVAIALSEKPSSIDSIPESKEERLLENELLASQILPIILHLDTTLHLEISDSLLEQVSGIHPTTVEPSLKTEFWHSPLNYHGYRMGKKQMLLFGVLPTDSARVHELDGVRYLVTKQQVYVLRYTDEFVPLQTVNDVSISAKLAKEN